MSSLPEPTAAIQVYYDQNTRFFSRLGSSSKVLSIHRALWPSGVTTLDQALNISNQLILQALQPLLTGEASDPLTLADLGCGIGGTLIYLLQNLPETARGLGLTISGVQACLARQHLSKAALRSQGLIVEGDFCALPLTTSFDALVSIEAFVHAPDAGQYLAEAARVLRPGGRLLLVDDFLRQADLPADPSQERWLRAYRSGWRVPGLSTLDAVCRQAKAHRLNLLEDRDLTPCLHLRTLPSHLTGWILSIGARIPLKHALLPSMLGSLALQHCLKAGLVQYHMLVFEKKHGN